MEAFKIKHFSNTHKGVSFPWHRSLTTNEMKVIQNGLASKLHLVEDQDSLNLVRAVAKLGKACHNFGDEGKHFNLVESLENLGVHSQQNVFINWYRFDHIDEMKLADLSHYFNDIWYPSSDDIDIFDNSLSWVLSVSHDGKLRVAYLGEKFQ